MPKPSFLDIHRDKNYKNAIIDSLTAGITTEWIEYYEMTMNYVISEKYGLFDKPEWKGTLYDDEDEILDLILPTIRRLFGKVFINPPAMFEVDKFVASTKGYKDDGRLELFRLHYDIDDFLDELIEQISISKDCLINFKNLDRSAMTFEIIVDNYIAGLIRKVTSSDDIKRDIRDLKIKKMVAND